MSAKKIKQNSKKTLVVQTKAGFDSGVENFLKNVMNVDNNRSNPVQAISKLLPSCPADKKFYVCDGAVYSSLYELVDGLKTMNQSTFRYHVNPQKNDFMNWVRDVFGDALLAREIAKIPHPVGMAKKVEGRIKVLQRSY